jgi:L(+)-tartrate dehydratase beta subunit
MREVHLHLPLTDTAARTLELGDAAFLSGIIFTGREGFYYQVFEKGLQPPLDLGHTCNVTFHCSHAVSKARPGEYHIPSITATASFRLAKNVPLVLERYGIRAVIGKGRMQEEVYQTAFRHHGAIYLTTVGYGPGAIYGQGIRRVKDGLWKNELGLVQAVWVLEVENFGPFLVEYDVEWRDLFGMANAEVNEAFEKLYEGLPQPALKRLGEVILPTDEVL